MNPILNSLKAIAAAVAVAAADAITGNLGLSADASFLEVATKLFEWALIGGAVWLIPNIKK